MKYALATVHRAENTDDPLQLRAVVEFLQEQAREHPVVLPLASAHPARCVPNGSGSGWSEGYRSGRLSRHGEAAAPCRRGLYGFRGASEGSLFPSRAVHHATRRNRVDRDDHRMAGTGFGRDRTMSRRAEIGEYGEGDAAFKIARLLGCPEAASRLVPAPGRLCQYSPPPRWVDFWVVGPPPQVYAKAAASVCQVLFHTSQAENEMISTTRISNR